MIKSFKVIMGNPLLMPLIDGHGSERVFRVAAGTESSFVPPPPLIYDFAFRIET